VPSPNTIINHLEALFASCRGILARLALSTSLRAWHFYDIESKHLSLLLRLLLTLSSIAPSPHTLHHHAFFVHLASSRGARRALIPSFASIIINNNNKTASWLDWEDLSLSTLVVLVATCCKSYRHIFFTLFVVCTTPIPYVLSSWIQQKLDHHRRIISPMPRTQRPMAHNQEERKDLVVEEQDQNGAAPIRDDFQPN
jgi:hypothetical protein